MIAALIFAISWLMLLQFFVSYSRSLIAESRSHVLSDQTGEITGLTARAVHPDQFERLLQLIALCPGITGDSNQVRVVSTYFRLLGIVRVTLGWAFPATARWVDVERGGCAYLAAVVLDRRIAYNRMLATQQASPSL